MTGASMPSATRSARRSGRSFRVRVIGTPLGDASDLSPSSLQTGAGLAGRASSVVCGKGRPPRRSARGRPQGPVGPAPPTIRRLVLADSWPLDLPSAAGRRWAGRSERPAKGISGPFVEGAFV